jgi:hypothetical protein
MKKIAVYLLAAYSNRRIGYVRTAWITVNRAHWDEKGSLILFDAEWAKGQGPEKPDALVQGGGFGGAVQ